MENLEDVIQDGYPAFQRNQKLTLIISLLI